MDRLRLKYIFWATFIGFAGGLPNFLYVFDINLYPIIPFCTYLVPLFPVLMVYAIVKHQILDIQIVIRKSLVYSLVVTLLTVGYFGLIYTIERLFQTTLGYQSLWFSLASFALMALAFQPLKVGIQRAVDWLFFRQPQEMVIKRLERLEEETRQIERLKAVATLAAGLAHEIKNPLTSIKTFAEYLPDRCNDPRFQEKFAKILQQEIYKINELVQRLLDFARPSQPQKKIACLSQLLDETVELLQSPLLSKRIEIIRVYGSKDTALVDPVQIKQVFLNILLNSIEAIAGDGSITISTCAENGSLRIVIKDTGQGIPKKDLGRIFDPFYTTKPRGTGLGLSIVHSIVHEHGGRVNIHSDTGRGTVVTVQVPAHHQETDYGFNGNMASTPVTHDLKPTATSP